MGLVREVGGVWWESESGGRGEASRSGPTIAHPTFEDHILNCVTRATDRNVPWSTDLVDASKGRGCSIEDESS